MKKKVESQRSFLCHRPETTMTTSVDFVRDNGDKLLVKVVMNGRPTDTLFFSDGKRPTLSFEERLLIENMVLYTHGNNILMRLGCKAPNETEPTKL